MRYLVAGVLAGFWAEQTDTAPEKIIGRDLSLADAREFARTMSISGFDDGAVDYWPETGGHTEIRNASGLVLAFVNGRAFTPEQWAVRQAQIS